MRFYPDEQKWSVVSEAFGAMVRAVHGRCPLLVPVSQFGDASAIGKATAELDAPVVLLGGHYTQLGDCLAALLRWPHLYLETSRLAHFRAIETVVRTVGAERVLFGSGAPRRPIQATLNAVVTADITEHEKRAILGANAARLFDIAAEPFDVPRAVLGSDLSDVHAHIGALGLPTPRIDPRTHAASVAPFGIARSIASSLRAIADDARSGNTEAFAARSDTLRTYVVVDPNALDASCQAMDGAYRHDLAVGAKLHCGWSKQHTASATCIALVREVARRGRPLKIHVDGPGWDAALACVAADFPNWRVILAHGGPGTPSLEGAWLVQSTPNVYLELATSFPDLPVVREVVQRVGPERLLFGSDAPLLDPAYVLGLYADAGADLVSTTAVARQVFDL